MQTVAVTLLYFYMITIKSVAIWMFLEFTATIDVI